MSETDPTAGERCRYVMHGPGDTCDCKARLAQVVTHTRTSTNGMGPDYCAECSAAVSEWVQWPCSCPCGCAGEMHIGEIGCPCGLPDEPHYAPAEPDAGDVEALAKVLHVRHGGFIYVLTCYDCRQVAQHILASDWLDAVRRKAGSDALTEAADDMVWDFNDHPVTRAAVREWINGQAARIAGGAA